MSKLHPPLVSELTGLRPRDFAGAFYVFLCISLSIFGIWISTSGITIVWLIGQIVLAIALLQWFIILHEAGHKTLFRTKNLNTFVGHIAGFLSGFPYSSWSIIHFRHHKWTGWQDMDATTASLVPRELSGWERIVINVCWKLWIPLFALIYRINNYWNYPRLIKFVSRSDQRRRIALEIIILLAAYAVLLLVMDSKMLLKLLGVAMLISLVLQEVIILSQHTHIPTNLSNGRHVRPFPPVEQEIFTRSLRFPSWISRLLLMHFDAHELHHMYPKIPGYYLAKIPYKPVNEINWWEWVRDSKRLSGEVFLFQDRTKTGFAL